MQHAETELSSVRISWWNAGGNDQLRAIWEGTAIPDDLVHNLLGWADTPAGVAGGRLERRPTLRIECRVTFGDYEFPF